MAVADASLEAVLPEPTRGPLHRLVPGRAGAKLAAKLALRPRTVARRSAGLAGEVARVAVGRSGLARAPRARRFKDPAWSENPFYRSLMQTYLALGRTVDGLICEADLD